MRLWWGCLILLLCCSVGLPADAASTSKTLNITLAAPTIVTRMGVSLAGAEFGLTYPGTYNTTYTYPTSSEFAYYNSKNLTLIRLPFVWERFQTSLGANLDSAQVSLMNAALSAADAFPNIKVLIDCHNYARYGTGTFSDPTSHGTPIGSGAVTAAAFADFWKKMATAFGTGHPSLLGYDLMNEPHDMPSSSAWPTAAQAAINAIRQVDTTHLIFVEGDAWAGSTLWATNNPTFPLSDSANKLVYEAHQYFDGNGSGQYTQTYAAQGATPTIGVTRVTPFVNWCNSHSVQCYVGEYGIPNADSSCSGDTCWLTVLDNFLQTLKTNHIWGTYWAGGPWWGNDKLSIEPSNYPCSPPSSCIDKIQMGVVKNYPTTP